MTGRLTEIVISVASVVSLLVISAGLCGCGDKGPSDAEKRQQAIAEAERQQAVDRLRKEVDDLSELLSQTENEIASTGQQLQAAEQQEPQASLLAKIDDLTKQIEQFEAEIVESTEALAAMNAMTPQAVREQPEVREAMQDDVGLQTLEAMLAGQQEELNSAEQRGADPADIAKLRNQLADTRQAYEERRDAAVTEIWETQQSQFAQTLEELEQETEKLRRQRRHAEQELYRLQKPFVEELAALNETKARLADQIASLQIRIKNIRSGEPLSVADRLGTTTQPDLPATRPAEPSGE
jgi:chromosome segregation ATPase